MLFYLFFTIFMKLDTRTLFHKRTIVHISFNAQHGGAVRAVCSGLQLNAITLKMRDFLIWLVGRAKIYKIYP